MKPGEADDVSTRRPPERLVMVVPTYEEKDGLAALVTAYFVARPDDALLVVDDRSPDGTAAACRALMPRFPGLLERDGPRGLGHAYVAGMRWAFDHGFDVVGTMDADLSHAPAHLPAMVEALASADVVVGSRYVHGGGTRNWRRSRIALSWCANRFAARLLGLGVADATSGYRLYRAAGLARVDLGAMRSTGYSFLAELLFRLVRQGLRVVESPILFEDRRVGRSKLGLGEIPRGVWSLVRLRLGAGGAGRR
jgi:dolichol-phosphate mannosyltransferase